MGRASSARRCAPPICTSGRISLAAPTRRLRPAPPQHRTDRRSCFLSVCLFVCLSVCAPRRYSSILAPTHHHPTLPSLLLPTQMLADILLQPAGLAVAPALAAYRFRQCVLPPYIGGAGLSSAVQCAHLAGNASAGIALGGQNECSMLECGRWGARHKPHGFFGQWSLRGSTDPPAKPLIFLRNPLILLPNLLIFLRTL